ncbi:sensor histidine kinase [Agromyces sp. LHK192]|uniref:sensor histidine kinase n=1 Tax=Agromyces sp. LHK192 TaxID=2498704 RepID=UPI000FD7C02B|nr:histidine kinase [Agromyces sp. LHK192]
MPSATVRPSETPTRSDVDRELPLVVRRFGPAAVALVAQLAFALAVLAQPGGASGAGGAVLAIVLVVAGPVALVFARTHPGPVVAVVAGLAVVHGLTTPLAWTPYVALWFAIGIAVAHGALIWSAVAAGVAWVGEILLGTIEGVAWRPIAAAVEAVMIAASFAIGWYVWVHRGRIALLRVEAHQRRRQSEVRARARIAAGLHDEIGQALSQAHVQASIALHLMDRDPGRARVALERIRETSQTALADLRSVVGAIRDDDEATLAELELVPRVLAEAESAGTATSYECALDRTPARPLQYATYRIAEEAVENAVRHAGASRVAVAIVHADDELVLTVDDDGDGLGDRAEERGGGLVGMRERAGLVGGSVDFVASPIGGTRVVVRMPWSDVA